MAFWTGARHTLAVTPASAARGTTKQQRCGSPDSLPSRKLDTSAGSGRAAARVRGGPGLAGQHGLHGRWFQEVGRWTGCGSAHFFSSKPVGCRGPVQIPVLPGIQWPLPSGLPAALVVSRGASCAPVSTSLHTACGSAVRLPAAPRSGAGVGW